MYSSSRMKEAVELGHRIGFVLLATADTSGVPNLAVANIIERASDDRLIISSWFCPNTVENLRRNPHLDVIVWDSDTDEGYQILGTAEEVMDAAVLDGYVPEDARSMRRLAQTEREVRVKVEKVLSFTRAPYCDVSTGKMET